MRNELEDLRAEIAAMIELLVDLRQKVESLGG